MTLAKTTGSKVKMAIFYLLGLAFFILFIPYDPLMITLHSLSITLMIVGLIMLVNRSGFIIAYEGGSTLKRAVGSVFIFLCCVVAMFGYLQAINGFLGPQQLTCITGTVIEKYQAEDKYGSKASFIKLRLEDGISTDSNLVSLAQYANVSVGDEYRKTWKRGGLGYLYLTTIGDAPGSQDYKGCVP